MEGNFDLRGGCRDPCRVGAWVAISLSQKKKIVPEFQEPPATTHPGPTPEPHTAPPGRATGRCCWARRGRCPPPLPRWTGSTPGRSPRMPQQPRFGRGSQPDGKRQHGPSKNATQKSKKNSKLQYHLGAPSGCTISAGEDLEKSLAPPMKILCFELK